MDADSEQCRLCKVNMATESVRDHLRQHHSSEVARVLLFPSSTNADDLWVLRGVNAVQDDNESRNANSSFGNMKAKEEPMDEVEETSSMTVTADDESSLEESIAIPRRRRGRPSRASKAAEEAAKAQAEKAAALRRTGVKADAEKRPAAQETVENNDTSSKAKAVRRSSRTKRARQTLENSDSEYQPSSDSEDEAAKKSAEPKLHTPLREPKYHAPPQVHTGQLLKTTQQSPLVSYCLECKRVVGQRAAHIYSVHIAKPTAKCPHCEFVSHRSQVVQHMKVTHKLTYTDPVDLTSLYRKEYLNWSSKCFAPLPASAPMPNAPTQTLKDLLDPSLLQQMTEATEPLPKATSLVRMTAPKLECAQCKQLVGVTEAVDHVNTAHAHIVLLTCPIDGCTVSSSSRRLVLSHMHNLHPEEWRWPRSNLFAQAGDMDKHMRRSFGKGLAELKTAAEQVELGERCAVCCRVVARLDRLTHTLAHMNPFGPRLFKCSWCDFATKTDAEAVKQHALEVHGAEGVVSRLDEYKDEIACWMGTCFLSK